MIESLMSALFSETVCVSSQTFFIEYSKTQYDVCTARSRLNSCSFILKVSEADFWCAVCAAARGGGASGGGASGGGASGRIHDKDTEEFSEAEHKESFYIFYQ